MEPRLTDISRKETLQYLSYQGETLSEDVIQELEHAKNIVFANAKPRVIWRMFPLEENGILHGTNFRPEGKSIQNLLCTCHSVILFAATIGSEIDTCIRRLQHINMAQALILDASASAAVENVCDNFCKDLQEAFKPDYLTDRFSPGYGDFPLSQQTDFFQVLDISRRIGVSLTASGLMLPQKTVTALIGVSTQPQPKRSNSCTECALSEKCIYRREGKNCEKT